MAKVQTYSNHTRFEPFYHFIASPIALLNLLIQLRHAYYYGTRYAWWNVLFAVGFLAIVASARLMVLSVQDRVIRLEMRLRLREVLPASMHTDIGKLSVRQLVALRFASDAELPDLVQRVLKGELVDQKAIKLAIKDWQADWLRA
ncbi:MAG: hypothetical protein H3C62_07870 [Gemmatimonadaceae bacterium]|nr:hypothetical protein [Gemmatimonadaceae bacterium]